MVGEINCLEAELLKKKYVLLQIVVLVSKIR